MKKGIIASIAALLILVGCDSKQFALLKEGLWEIQSMEITDVSDEILMGTGVSEEAFITMMEEDMVEQLENENSIELVFADDNVETTMISNGVRGNTETVECQFDAEKNCIIQEDVALGEKVEYRLITVTEEIAEIELTLYDRNTYAMTSNITLSVKE